jgi:hypothetical protein
MAASIRARLGRHLGEHVVRDRRPAVDRRLVGDLPQPRLDGGALGAERGHGQEQEPAAAGRTS